VAGILTADRKSIYGLCLLVGVLSMTACADYEGKFILHLKVKNCSGVDQSVQISHNPNVKMAAADFVIPAGSQKLIGWGSQCWQCGSDYSCAGISFRVSSPKELIIGDMENTSASCPAELGRHEISITCNDTTCGATKLTGDLSQRSASQEPQC
jgi:hypothetical protein